MYCKKCGNILKQGGFFCTKCGTKIEPQMNFNVNEENNINNIVSEQNQIKKEQNNKIGKIPSIILSIVTFLIYCIINFKFINNANLIINYLFVLILFLCFIKIPLDIFNNKYFLYNEKYMRRLYILRIIWKFLARNLYSGHIDSLIKEGNEYIIKNKFLFVSIKTGFILLLTLIWHFLLFDNSIISDNIMLPILIVLIFVMLAFLPFLLSLISVGLRLDKISRNTDKKMKIEDIIIISMLGLVLILDIIMVKIIENKDILSLNLCLIIIIFLLYKPIKKVCTKKRDKQARIKQDGE